MSTEIAIDTTVTISRRRAPSIFRHPIVALLLGIVLPLLCIWFDPIVFRSDFGQSIVGSYNILCYGYMGLAMLSMVAWQLGQKLPSFFTGVLFGGWSFAMVLGTVLLPISVFCLLFFIGIFGFSPFLTAAAFWHSAKHAREVAGNHFNRVVAILAFVLFVTLPLGAEAGIALFTRNAVHEITTGSDQSAAQAIARLKLFGPAFDSDLLVRAHRTASSELERERLEKTYWELTGHTIEDRHIRLND